MGIAEYLEYLVDKDGSDLHLKAGGPSFVRIDGDLNEVPDLPELDPADTERFADEVMDERAARRFAEGEEVDLSYSLAGVGRFRIAVFRQRGSVGLVIRRVLSGAQTCEELGMPTAVRRLAEPARGLVLVTGQTGSGKTTTTAAMLNHINSTRRCHVVTIEDPIEVLYQDDLAIIDQREIGTDTAGFAPALRAASRHDPDVIFIGEMRDPETCAAALQAAETGHLVISTLHTSDAAETINRIVDFFPPYQQGQIRRSLAGSLAGVVSQRLVPQVGGGRVAAVECLVMTTRLHDFVLDPEKTDEITGAVAEGSYYGMQTFDQHLLELLRQRQLTLRDATASATNSHDFRLAARGAGLA